MNKLISVLAVTVIILPLSVTVLLSGPDNLLDACQAFFEKLLERAVSFGVV
ncbi:hypothetical protein [Brevibacillus marinus]|jgi:hypothetical protein|uniref:hypothetical protein n=1 Tax=Brevibacillus marinus TaxID=2496837 RepID=UPI0013DE9E35|nr:hypothetical protein [Brevibacillus marinus]